MNFCVMGVDVTRASPWNKDLHSETAELNPRPAAAAPWIVLPHHSFASDE